MTDYEHRKQMWIMLSHLFLGDVEELDFLWIYSKRDAEEANGFPDGMGGLRHAGVCRGVV